MGTDESSPGAPQPALRLDGKVAWITGASRGLGLALAQTFAGAGAQLALMARSQGRLVEIAADIARGGGTAEVLPGSVSDVRDVDRAAGRIADRWGRLDILVNNAGISPSYTRSEALAVDDWRQIIDINLTGPFLCCKAAVPLMEKAGSGSVINISSIHGFAAGERMVAYAASKGGVEMLTRTLGVEWAPRNIRVNAVAPGYLETEMTTGLRDNQRLREAFLARIPLGRFGSPSEVVGAALFLASDLSSYITGATFVVDGGWVAR